MNARVIADYRQALAIGRDLQDRWTIATVLARLADTLDATGRTVEARNCWSEAHTIFSELGDPQALILRARLDVNLATTADTNGGVQLARPDS